MADYLNNCITWPVLPASLLLLVVMGYWALAILGAFDLDAFDLDLDGDADLDLDLEAATSIGLLGLRFLNLGRVPLMLWVSAFALAWWLTSMLWNAPQYRESWGIIALITLRNAGVALVATKLLTEPLAWGFAPKPGSRVPDGPELVGRRCTITSAASETHGQARVETDAAPLLINVRATYGTMPRGTPAEIVDFDPDQHVYFVTHLDFQEST